MSHTIIPKVSRAPFSSEASLLRGYPVKAVPHPRLRRDEPRRLGIPFDLLPQILDEDAQVIHLVAIVRAPDRLQQLAVGNRFVGALGEISEQVQLFRREVGGSASV